MSKERFSKLQKTILAYVYSTERYEIPQRELSKEVAKYYEGGYLPVANFPLFGDPHLITNNMERIIFDDKYAQDIVNLINENIKEIGFDRLFLSPAYCVSFSRAIRNLYYKGWIADVCDKCPYFEIDHGRYKERTLLFAEDENLRVRSLLNNKELLKERYPVLNLTLFRKYLLEIAFGKSSKHFKNIHLYNELIKLKPELQKLKPYKLLQVWKKYAGNN